MMVKSIALQNIDMDYAPTIERWYYAVHSPQVARRYGPWLARHESYLPVYTPPEAAPFGACNWRYIHCYWRELPNGLDGQLALTPCPRKFYVASAFLPPTPTEDFKGKDFRAEDKQVLRWVQLIKYPQGVDKEEADRWYVEVFAPEACRQRHMYRFFSTKTIRKGLHLPGHIAPADLDSFAEQTDPNWDRFSEMWYESYADWREDVILHPPAYTAPPWAQQAEFPFLTPRTNFVSSFLLEKPSDDYLSYDRVYL